MGGRGGGSPAGRQGPAAALPGTTIGEREAGQINITIVEKPSDGPWRMIGDAPESFIGDAGLLVTRANSGTGFDVRNIVTDEILASGSTIKGALRNLAKTSGLRVNYVDETAGGKVLGTFGS